MSQTLHTYRALADDFEARVNAVPDSAWDNQSPCADWKARDVVTHVVGVGRRNLAILAGEAAVPGDLADMLAQIDNYGSKAVGSGDNESVKAAWKAMRSDMEAALSDPAQAGKAVTTAMGEMPFEQLIGRFICPDLLVHTWDLARAAGLDEKLNEQAVAHVYEGMKPMDAMLRAPGFFDNKVEPPAGADTQTQLLSFLGRKV